MIYASAIFRSKDSTAVVVFDKDYSVYGPYKMDGWKGDPFSELSSDDLLFAFCSFKLNDASIDVKEHHEKMKNNEGGPPPECIGYLFNQTKVEADFDISTLDRMLRSLAGKAMVREYVKDNFMRAWNIAKATGQHSMNEVAKELNVTFNEVESAIVG
jgi:hypothetical protein